LGELTAFLYSSWMNFRERLRCGSGKEAGNEGEKRRRAREGEKLGKVGSSQCLGRIDANDIDSFHV